MKRSLLYRGEFRSKERGKLVIDYRVYKSKVTKVITVYLPVLLNHIIIVILDIAIYLTYHNVMILLPVGGVSCLLFSSCVCAF